MNDNVDAFVYVLYDVELLGGSYNYVEPLGVFTSVKRIREYLGKDRLKLYPLKKWGSRHKHIDFYAYRKFYLNELIHDDEPVKGVQESKPVKLYIV